MREHLSSTYHFFKRKNSKDQEMNKVLHEMGPQMREMFLPGIISNLRDPHYVQTYPTRHYFHETESSTICKIEKNLTFASVTEYFSEEEKKSLAGSIYRTYMEFHVNRECQKLFGDPEERESLSVSYNRRAKNKPENKTETDDLNDFLKKE